MKNGIDDPLRSLHERILHGDRTALDQLAERLFETLPRTLRRYPLAIVEPAVALDALTDAIIEYSKRPERFDPSKDVPLSLFIRHLAVRNLQDAHRARQRMLAHEETHAPHEIADLARPPQEDKDSRREQRARLYQAARAVCCDYEYVAFRIWMGGDRVASALVGVLRLLHLPEDEQRRAVNRFKERIRKCLLRRLR